jgi:hypothetical protein
MGEPDDTRSLLGKAPWSPPIVEMGEGIVAHLLCWELRERDGSWSAWVSWVQSTGTPVRHRHKVVTVRAGALSPLEAPDAYLQVPRRVGGLDGRFRLWTGPARGRR